MEKLNIDSAIGRSLNRNEMKQIIAGNGPCRVAMRDQETDEFVGYSGCMSYEDAWADWNWSVNYSDGTYASGYCCASCGDEEAGFGNTTPCMSS